MFVTKKIERSAYRRQNPGLKGMKEEFLNRAQSCSGYLEYELEKLAIIKYQNENRKSFL